MYFVYLDLQIPRYKLYKYCDFYFCYRRCSKIYAKLSKMQGAIKKLENEELRRTPLPWKIKDPLARGILVSSTIEISICSKISPPDLCESSNHGPGASFRETFAKQGQHKMCCRTAPAIMRKKKNLWFLGQSITQKLGRSQAWMI